MTGAEAERELRKQLREAAHRSGPSTAALEAEVWFSVVQHCEGMSDRAVVAEFGVAIEALTGIKAASKQRSIVSAARKTKGNRLWLTTAGGFGDEAERQMQQIAQDAQREADAEHARHIAQSQQGGGYTEAHAIAKRMRDAILIEAATGANPGERLKNANAALSEAGFPEVSESTLYRAQRKLG